MDFVGMESTDKAQCGVWAEGLRKQSPLLGEQHLRVGRKRCAKFNVSCANLCKIK